MPDAGDLVWLTFDPQAGREQRGRRPVRILSPRAYNSKSGLALACPVTSRKKAYPFEVDLPDDAAITGVVLADHVKSVDWKARRAERGVTAPPGVLTEVREKLRPVLGL